jgi:hypothetical protein
VFGVMLQFMFQALCAVGNECWSIGYCVRKLGNFRYILIPEIINKFMTIISDPVRTEHVHVFKLNLK